jgi:hypothetical protein
MEDNAALELQNRQNDEEYARIHLLGDDYTLTLDEASMDWILNHIDCFVSQSRGNESIQEVKLAPYVFNGHDYDIWDKVGQAVGNLQALQKLSIYTPNYGYFVDEDEDDDEDNAYWAELAHDHEVDWEILARILSHVRQKITLAVTEAEVQAWDADEPRLFARAIRGHPTITHFEDRMGLSDFPYASSDALYSALASLPALESLILSNSKRQVQPEDEPALAHPESLTELLRAPSLRFVCFECFSFTYALCQATANALMEGTPITELVFRYCAFSAEGSVVMMANGFSRNTSVTSIFVQGDNAPTLLDALAAALPSNATLQDISFSFSPSYDDDDDAYLDRSPIFSALDCVVLVAALQHNETLKSLNISGHCSLTLTDDEDKHMTALLQKNYALESLPGIQLYGRPGDVAAILRLNRAGRRYLIEDGSSISKGVDVLSAVSDEINCVFLHLLENPTLCDRSAVEVYCSQ